MRPSRDPRPATHGRNTVLAEPVTPRPVLAEPVTPRPGLAEPVIPRPRSDGAPPPDSAADALAGGVARYRREAGLTLVALADRCDLSPAYLSQIEAGTANPTLSSVAKVAEALGRPVVALYGGGPDSMPEAIFPACFRPRPVPPADGTPGRVWDYTAPGSRRLQARLTARVPGDHGELRRHPGEEFVVVLAGRYRLSVGAAQRVLEPGDACHFAGTESHRLVPLTGDAMSLVVLSGA